MSEFTEGVLFQNHALSKIYRVIPKQLPPFKIVTLNDKWAALFIKDNPYRDLEIVNILKKVSKQTPLLLFFDAEDHGWGYRAYKKGKEVANLEISYEIDWNMTLDLAEARHPDVTDFFGSTQFTGEMWEALNAEVLTSEPYRARVIQQYRNRNFKALGDFDLRIDILETLEKSITPDAYFDSASRHQQVTIFKTALGVTEMSWMSYRYLEREA